MIIFRRGSAAPLVLIALLLTSCIRQDAHLQRPVLQVNSNVLTAKEFADQLTERLRSADAISAKDPENLERAKSSVLREFIVESLITDWAQKNDLKPTQEAIEQELERVRAGYPDDLALRRMLTHEKVSPKQWRQSVEKRLLRELVMAQLRAEIPEPSPEEQKTYYESHKKSFEQPRAVRLRQVVTQRENDAERILSSIRSGKDISDLAKEFSSAPERADGGLTDWIEEGVLEVFDKAFEMRIGELSGILESPFGYHIYRVVEKRSARTLSLEEARPKIIQTLLTAREQHRYKAWLEGEVRRAQVFKDDKLLESIKVETRH